MGDVDFDEAARGVAIEDSVEIGLARAAAFVDGVAAAGAVDRDALDDDIGAVLDGEDGVDLAVARRTGGLDEVGRRLDGDVGADVGDDGEIGETIDLDLFDIDAGGDDDGVAVAGRVYCFLDGGEPARAYEVNGHINTFCWGVRRLQSQQGHSSSGARSTEMPLQFAAPYSEAQDFAPRFATIFVHLMTRWAWRTRSGQAGRRACSNPLLQGLSASMS